MDEQKSLSKEFFQNIIKTFAYSVIAISIVGLLIGDAAKEFSNLFSFGSEGLSYPALLQIFICSVVIGCLRTLLLSDLIFKKMMLLWRYVLLLLLTFISTGFLVVLFRWFPVDLWEAWVGFIIAVIACFVIAASCMIIKTKLEDIKYDRLLSNYKAKQNEESGE